jgi:AsmA-like C-terminal region
MSEIYVEPIASTRHADSAAPRQRAVWRWPKRLLILLALLWIAAEGISLAIQHTRLRRVITSHFEAAMGRPVEVGSYHFSFWDGPVIEARSVVVGEDPRFGAEYFLRADSTVVHLRLRSLLHGRAEFGTISLNHPSLNLVRNSSGRWNLAEWLPRPSAALPAHEFAGPMTPSPATSFRRIEIDGGRVNFKLADEKLPFAFVGVSGVVEMSGPGRWSMNLQATPWRAAVALQQAGVIQVSGEMGGTSSRLRPSAIHITWAGASLPDLLRLARDNDFGVRGVLSLSVDARTNSDAEGWTLKARAQLQQIHRWDLSLRPDNPALNLTAQISYRPLSPYIELTQATIEAPHSSLNASGRVYWNGEAPLHNQPVVPPQMVISSADVDARDLLAWAHAFHSGIADDLSVRGLAHLDAALAGWPPRIARAEFSSDGVDLSGAAWKAAHVGRLQVHFISDSANGNAHGLASLGPVTVSWGSAGHPEGVLRLENVAKRMPGAVPVWRVFGSTGQVRDLIAGANALGWNIPRGWDVAGPFACDLRWQQAGDFHFADALRQVSGWMEFGAPASGSDGAVLRVPFLNLPIEQIRGRLELKAGVRHAKLVSAQAFGARWSGTVERNDPSMPWQFDLAADQLSTADLDRWLNPRWRESFFDRMLPFLNSRSETNVAPENLQAVGHLAIGHFALARLMVSRLQSDIALHSRRITATNAAGQFYGGEVIGAFDAILQAVPSYSADLAFSHVDPSRLMATAPSLAGFTVESADGQLSFAARGASRSDLISSLTCQGTARVTGAELLHFDLWSSLVTDSLGSGDTRFAEGDADFSCARGKIEFHRLQLLADSESSIDGSGSVDFKGAVDLRFNAERYIPGVQAPAGTEFRLMGTLGAPQVSPILTSALRRSR